MPRGYNFRDIVCVRFEQGPGADAELVGAAHLRRVRLDEVLEVLRPRPDVDEPYLRGMTCRMRLTNVVIGFSPGYEQCRRYTGYNRRVDLVKLASTRPHLQHAS